MNGMRKVGHKSASRQAILDESDELDFNQDLDDVLEDIEPNEEKETIKDGGVFQNTESLKDIHLNKNSEERDELHVQVSEDSMSKQKSEQSVELKLDEDIVFRLPDAECLALLDKSDISSCESSSDKDRNLKSVYVKNVDYDTNPKELEEHFKSCGEISRITIFVDKYTGLSKGYAFVEFTSQDAKEKAIAMSDSLFKGKPIRVEDKRRNIPDYYTKKIKSNRTPVYMNEFQGRGSGRYGPIKGRYTTQRNFKPY